MRMRMIICTAFIFLISLQVRGQLTITGILLDYNDQQPHPYGLFSIDSTLHFRNAKMLESNNFKEDGTFTIDCGQVDDFFNLKIGSIGFESLIIKNIDSKDSDSINLGNLYMLQSSYHWDGECLKRRFFGLIKIKYECGGYIKGIIEENAVEDEVLLEYPEGQTEKRFRIQNEDVIIDLNEIMLDN